MSIWDALYSQEQILYMRKIKIQSEAERKESLRKMKTRKGYINKKHNLVRK